nr:hypothetical protein BgiMline_031750 [Biomphalaria glabrata]
MESSSESMSNQTNSALAYITYLPALVYITKFVSHYLTTCQFNPLHTVNDSDDRMTRVDLYLYVYHKYKGPQILNQLVPGNTCYPTVTTCLAPLMRLQPDVQPQSDIECSIEIPKRRPIP